MNQTEITAAVRRAIREPSPRRVSDSDITAVTLRGVTLIGLKIKEKDPGYFNKRVSLTSYSNVFDFPSDCVKVNNVWDYEDTAIAITGAADNGSGAIRITAVSHGLTDEMIVTVHDVGGTTEADGTWMIDYVDENTFDLLGSTFANAYTSGGKVFEEKSDMLEITKINMSEQTNANNRGYYLRSKKIVVDDVNFTDDIIIDYEGYPTTIAEIPSEYHEYLPAWCVINLIEIPPQDDPHFNDMIRTKQLQEAIIQMVENDIQRTFKSSSGPSQVRNVWAN